MSWVKKGWIFSALMAVVSFSSACIDEEIVEPEGEVDVAADQQPSAPVALEAIENQFEQISWQMGVGGADWRNELPKQPDGLCDCNGHACYEDWVDTNVGCDVCVAFRCPGQAPEHVCVSC